MMSAGSLLHAYADDAAGRAVAPADLIPRLDRLGAGALLTLIGLDGAGLRAAAEVNHFARRRMLQLDFTGVGSTTQAVARILDDLANLALALWPNWAGGSAEPAHMPDVLAAWRRPASLLAAAGRPPRFRRVLPRIELRQLLAAIDPDGLILVATVDPAYPHAAAARIAALEWCAGVGASIVVLSQSRPPPAPPFDRILYGAVEVVLPSTPVLDRLIAPSGKLSRGSQTEKRIREAIYLDRELSGLFEDEVTLPLGPLGPSPRVDLLWRAGKIVVEIDGVEHERDPNYGADRHRDYELLVAGYLVLRLTNAEIAIDLDRAVDKIRRVVNLRRKAE